MKAIVEQTPTTNSNPVLTVSQDGTIIYSNEAGEPLLQEWGVRIGEKVPTFIIDFTQRVILRNIPERMELETERRVYLLFFQPLPAEEHVSIYGFDISNQKKLEEALRETEEKLRHIIKHAPTGVFEIDFNGPKYINVNEAFCQMSGYTREELLAISPFELMVDESKSKLNERLVKSFSGKGISPQEEYLVVGKNGRKLWVLVNAHFTYKNEKIVGAFVIAHDITERKQAEKALCKSERHYRLLFETMLQGIVYHDSDGKILSMNPAAERIFGNNSAEFLDSSYLGEKYYTIREDGSPFPVREHPAMISLGTGQEVQNVVMGVYNPRENCYRWVNTSSVPMIVLGEDRPFQVYTLLDDITERKKAEEILKKIEIARKQEIHHRIKNNLQVISSLLDLQADKLKKKESITESEVLNAFKESQDRVLSMALIHEELHKSEEIDTLNISLYVEELADNLFLSYRVGKDDICLDTNIEEDIFFDMDTAVPLGIIVNELISNSLKYAFNGCDNGKIQVKLHREGNEECKIEDCKRTVYVLSVSDNGTGIPEDIDIEELDSLGLQLVTTLVDQLDGILELKRDNGTEFTIRFTVSMENNQVSTPATK